MPSKAKKVKTVEVKDKGNIDAVALDLIYSEDTQFRYWTSHLFNDVYLRKDLPLNYPKMWNADDTQEFQYFMNTVRDLAFEYGKQEKSLRKWSEAETINNWIKPILNALGWANNCTGVQNPYLEETSFSYEKKTYRTDILIVDLPKEKKYVREVSGQEKLNRSRERESVLIPVEAKYWKRLEQYQKEIKEDRYRKDRKDDDVSRVTSPDEQILKYMELLQKDWGVLTDGAVWRLYNRDISGDDPERYFEFNLASLVDSILTESNEHDRREVIESAKYFYFFFSKNAHRPENVSDPRFVDEILRYSKKYVNKVEEDLKHRFVKAMNHACNGLYRAMKQNKVTSDLTVIRNVAESMLFNILFLKSLESRNILPMNNPNYRKVSLSNIIDKIETFSPDKNDESNLRDLKGVFSLGNGNAFSYREDGSEIHNRVIRLTKIIHDGNSKKDDFGFAIAGFKECIFSKEEWKIFQECKLDNSTWVKVLFEIGYAESDIRSRKYQQIPYSYFSSRQLGSIYESLLEFKLDVADKDMVFEKKQWKEADLKSKKYRETNLPVVCKWGLFFTPDNKERKATGSYYTPDYIVQYIVNETLGGLTFKTSRDVLKKKVCDPAMGSGHFLVNTLKWLTSKYVKLLSIESSGDVEITMQEAKRRVLDSCIFGVDINDRAVKLAKMSLWLESAHINYKLENLDDQLKVGNSLSNKDTIYYSGFRWKESFDKVFQGQGGFDCIIGNPPYINMRNMRNDPKATELVDLILADSTYHSLAGSFDIYIAFLERSLGLLNDRGNVCFIVPNKVLVADYAEKVRENIFSQHLEMLTNVSELKIFGDVNVYPVIVKYGRRRNTSREVEVLLAKTKKYLIEPKFDKLSVDDITDDSGVIGFVSSEYGISKRKLGEVCKLEAGITGFSAKKYLNCLHNGKTSNTDIPFIVTGNIDPYKIVFGDVRYMKAHFKDPYLDTSHEVVTSGKKKLFMGDKIVIGGMTKRIEAARIKVPCAVGVGVYSVFQSSYPFEVVLAVLNSNVFSTLYYERFQSKHLAGGYLAINKSQLEHSDFPEEIDILTQKRLIDLVLRMNDKNELKIRTEIEKVVMSLYGLTVEEVDRFSKDFSGGESEEIKRSA